MNSEKTHPGVAAVLSFLFTGVGQLYNGQLCKGLMLFLCASLGMLLIVVGAVLLGFWMFGNTLIPGQGILGALFFLSGIILSGTFGIYSIVDAFRTASGKDTNKEAVSA